MDSEEKSDSSGGNSGQHVGGQRVKKKKPAKKGKVKQPTEEPEKKKKEVKQPTCWSERDQGNALIKTPYTEEPFRSAFEGGHYPHASQYIANNLNRSHRVNYAAGDTAMLPSGALLVATGDAVTAKPTTLSSYKGDELTTNFCEHPTYKHDDTNTRLYKVKELPTDRKDRIAGKRLPIQPVKGSDEVDISELKLLPDDELLVGLCRKKYDKNFARTQELNPHITFPELVKKSDRGDATFRYLNNLQPREDYWEKQTTPAPMSLDLAVKRRIRESFDKAEDPYCEDWLKRHVPGDIFTVSVEHNENYTVASPNGSARKRSRRATNTDAEQPSNDADKENPAATVVEPPSYIVEALKRNHPGAEFRWSEYRPNEWVCDQEVRCPFCLPANVATTAEPNSRFIWVSNVSVLLLPKGRKQTGNPSDFEGWRENLSDDKRLNALAQRINDHNEVHDKAGIVRLSFGYKRKFPASYDSYLVDQHVHQMAVHDAMQLLYPTTTELPLKFFTDLQKSGDQMPLLMELIKIWTATRTYLDRDYLRLSKPSDENTLAGFQRKLPRDFFIKQVGTTDGLAQAFADSCWEYWEDVNRRLGLIDLMQLVDFGADPLYAWNAMNLWLQVGFRFDDNFFLFGPTKLKNKGQSMADLQKSLQPVLPAVKEETSQPVPPAVSAETKQTGLPM